MDVEVGRAARAVEVEHAAARPRGPELDLARLGGDGEGLARSEDVVPLVRALRARRAEVVGVLHRPDDREDEPRRLRRARPRAGRPRGPCDRRDRGRDEDGASGCRPVASHRAPVRARRAGR